EPARLRLERLRCLQIRVRYAVVQQFERFDRQARHGTTVRQGDVERDQDVRGRLRLGIQDLDHEGAILGTQGVAAPCQSGQYENRCTPTPYAHPATALPGER